MLYEMLLVKIYLTGKYIKFARFVTKKYSGPEAQNTLANHKTQQKIAMQQQITKTATFTLTNQC